MASATTDKLLRRVLARAGAPELLEALAERLPLTDLQSLLLEVYRRRVAALTPRDLARQYADNRFVRPSPVDPRRQLAFDQLCLSLLPDGFEALELSPVSPLGSCAALGPVDQNNALTTIRGTEVCADATNALALECARRRRALPPPRRGPVKLCASHRLLRTQRFEGRATVAHFRLLGLCTAGRGERAHGFEAAALTEQLGFYLRLLGRAGALGLRFDAPRLHLELLEPAARPALARALDALEPLARRAPRTRIELVEAGERPSAGSYYRLARVQLHARDRDGGELLLMDGGFTDWTAKLLSDRKERLLISGLGTERLFLAFGA